MPFDLNCQNIFLTYPQCDLEREDALEQLKKICGSKYNSSVICQEEHAPKKESCPGQDKDDYEGLHLHVYLYVRPRLHTRNERYFDLKGEDGKIFHAHIEPARNKEAVLRYITMEDQDVLEDNISVKEYLISVKNHTKYGFKGAVEDIKDGKNILELWNDPEKAPFLLSHKRQIDDGYKLQSSLKTQEEVRPTFKGVLGKNVTGEWIYIVNWINHNFLKKRKFRQKQLWLWGKESGLGKSFFFLQMLPHYKKMYPWVKGDFQKEGIRTAEYILLDEYQAAVMTANDLKKLAQMGGEVIANIKYENQYTLTQNIPLIVTSQRSIRETYHGCEECDWLALEKRFLEIHVEKGFRMKIKDKKQDWPNGAPWDEPPEIDMLAFDYVIDPSDLEEEEEELSELSEYSQKQKKQKK